MEVHYVYDQSIKKEFIYLFIYLFSNLGFPGGSHFAYGNVEISGHFGKKLKKYGALNFGADTLFYRLSLDENSSFALGARYRYFFGSIATNINITGMTIETQEARKPHKHRLALLTNYRFLLHRSFFIGAIAGIDIWKFLTLTNKISGSYKEIPANADVNITSSQFLWNRITGQLALELGYMSTSNFLVKLEVGYDIFGFNKYKVEATATLEGTGTGTGSDDAEGDFNLNGVYATFGLGYFFG